MVTSIRKSIIVFSCMLVFPFAALSAGDGGITPAMLKEYNEVEFDGMAKALSDALANKSISDIALNRERYIQHSPIVNHKIKTGSITHQKSSGRCWMFAGFNVLRPFVMEKYKLKDFEFSQNYLLFWDKMEKSNLFLQAMIDMAERDLDDRELQVIIDGPLGDGGWWTYFTGLVEKYGVVPREVMPETHNSSSTGSMNSLVNLLLKSHGVHLREMARQGIKKSELMDKKAEMLKEIHHMLRMNLGTPPKEFTWRYETSDSAGIVTHPDTFTPKSFAKEVLNVDLADYVALFNYPGKPYFENYSMKWSRNMYDRPNFAVLNLPIDSLSKYAALSVLDSTPVWFACDVGKEQYSESGIMALDIFNFEEIYGLAFDLPKKDLIEMSLITPNHAMTFIGVDTTNGEVNKWLVENSWGKERGDNGLWYMYPDWFDRYMFGVIIHKDYLGDDIKAMSRKSPIELEPWDPMYNLNRLD